MTAKKFLPCAGKEIANFVDTDAVLWDYREKEIALNLRTWDILKKYCYSNGWRLEKELRKFCRDYQQHSSQQPEYLNGRLRC